MVCPSCKNEISNAHSHCYFCGYDLTEHIAPLHCKCGSIRPGSHIYCTDCGRELSRENVVLDKTRVAEFYAERAALAKQVLSTSDKKHVTIEDLISSTASLKHAAPIVEKTVVALPQKKDSSFLIVGLLSLVALGVLFVVGLGKKEEIENPDAAKIVTARKTNMEKAAESNPKTPNSDTAQGLIVSKMATPVDAKTPAFSTKEDADNAVIKQDKKLSESELLPVKAVKAEAVADVAEVNGKKLRYLVTTSGGTIGYFGDGTYTALPQGTFTKQSIKALYEAPTTGNYKGDLTVGVSDKNWFVIDYKWIKVPQ